MKGGRGKRRRPQPETFDLPEQRFGSMQEKAAHSMTMARENAVAMRNKKHISTQPLWVQQSFANRNKPLDQVMPKRKKPPQ